MAEYGTCECQKCYRIVPKPEAHRVTFQVEKGRIGGSFRFGSRSSSFSSGRTHYVTKDVWVCAGCYGAHAKARAKARREQGATVLAFVCVAIFIWVATSFFGGQDQFTKPPSIEQPQMAQATESANPTVNYFRPEDTPRQTAAPSAAHIKQLQSRLIELGYLAGSADGVWGAKSRTALRAFKSAHGFNPDDSWDDSVSKRLFSRNAVRAPLPIATAQ